MSIRWPALLPAALAATIGLFALTSVLTAQPPAPPAGGSAEPKSTADLRTQEEQNAELFRKFQRELLSLAQKLERSERAEDKERAKVLYAALELARKEGVDNQFQKLVAGLGKGSANPLELQGLLGQDQQLNKALQDILTVLMTDDESARIKAEIARLEAFLKEAREIKKRQEILRAMTDAQKGDPNRLAKNQNDLASQTRELGDRMAGGKKDAGKSGDGQGGKEGLAKADPKPEAKPGESAGDGKSDTQEAKADTKDAAAGDPSKAGGEAGAEAKAGSKEGQPSEAASSAKPGSESAKAGEAGMGRDAGDPKAGEGEPKAGTGNEPSGNKPGPGQEAGKPGDPKPGAGQPSGEPKPGGDPKAGGEPSGGKPGDGQSGSEKPGSEQAGGKDAQKGASGDQKGDSKGPGQGKGQDKGAQGQQGGDSKGKNAQGGEQQAGSKGGGQQSGGQQSGGQQSGGQQSGGQQGQQPQQTPGRKQIEEAYPHQKAAVEDLKKEDRNQAGKKEDKAIEELAKAIQELEKRLKQLREEELLKLLANLEARCNRMLAMQIEVYEATKAIDGIVQKNNGQKTNAEVQKAQQQGDKEQEIVTEADKALKLLETEGSAVAFARVLEEVRQDMIAVQRRLTDARVDRETQEIEENIIALLKDMVLALKKAQQDMQQQQNQPPPPSGQQKPGNKQLIDLLAELKLIRSLQVQVNTRTKNYGEKYKGEQASDPLIQAELKQLSDRQAKIQDMLDKIVKGSNQ